MGELTSDTLSETLPKVFIASSRELGEDRDALSRLISSLNHFYTEKGIYIQTYMYEDEDSNYNGRKQDDYNANIADSDIFICLFWTKAGQYTIEEFDVACKKYKESKKPAIYIYLKDNANSSEEKSLTEFKERLEKEIGHFPGRYSHTDTLKFDFLTKWIKFNPVIDFTAITVRNEIVYVHQTPTTINVSKIDFVSNNNEYAEILKKIDKAMDRVNKYPDDEDFVDELCELKKIQSAFESGIIDTALMISKLDNRHSSTRLDQAIALFKEGNHKGAMSILNTDTIKDDVESNILKLDKLDNIRNEYQSNLKTHVDELMLKASLIVNQFNLNKFEEAEGIYSYILSILNKLDDDIQTEIMFDIAREYENLYNHSKAIELLEKLKDYNLNNRQQVLVFAKLGEIYMKLHNYHKATQCFLQTDTICEDNQYNCVTLPEINHLLLLYLQSARLLHLTDEEGYGELINMVIALSDQVYGKEVCKENAIYHMYHSLYLIEQCKEKENGYQILQEIQNKLISTKAADCRLQLAQVYQIYAQLYHNSSLPELFSPGYKYATESLSIFKNMTDDEIYGSLNQYLGSVAIASQYEDKNKNYLGAINIVREALNKISRLSDNRIDSFNSAIIEIVYNGISASIQSRKDDESIDLSWLSSYLPMVLNAMCKSQCQSDLHSLFTKEYLIVGTILKGISFEKDQTLKLKFEKLLVELCDSEFASSYDNVKNISRIVINSILELGKYAVSKSLYKEVLHYAKVGVKFIDIIVKNDQEESPDIIPLFIEAMVGMIPYYTIPDSEVKFESYELLKEANKLFMQLEDMNDDVKESYIENCNNLSLLAVQRGDVNYGMELISRALTLNPNDVDLLDTLGEICISSKNFDKVELIVNKILSIDKSYFIENETPFTKFIRNNIN